MTMVFWVVVADAVTAEVVRRRPCGSLQEAQKYCEKIKGEYRSCVIDIKPLPRGQFPH
jgi:hypothetical protein